MKRSIEFDDKLLVKVYGRRSEMESFVYEFCCFWTGIGYVVQHIDVPRDKWAENGGKTELLLLAIEAEYKERVSKLAEEHCVRFVEGWY